MILLAGILACLDGFMNIVMEQTEEYVDGELQNKYGECFIRGNNGLWYFPVLSSSVRSPVRGVRRSQLCHSMAIMLFVVMSH